MDNRCGICGMLISNNKLVCDGCEIEARLIEKDWAEKKNKEEDKYSNKSSDSKESK